MVSELALTLVCKALPATNSIAEVMNTNFRSSPRLANSAWSSGAAVRVTAACSDEPTCPAARSTSISLFTTSRISRRRDHLASSPSSAPAMEP
ncbi:hypothetical protein D3C71_1796710 [compost metagenome]